MKCERCNYENPPEFSFCGKCGLPLVYVCQRCGTHHPTGMAFCRQCGAPLTLNCSRCGFQSPPGFAFCGKCGAALEAKPDLLAPEDLDHLDVYLLPSFVEELRYNLPQPSPRLLERCMSLLFTLLATTFTHLPAYLVKHIMQNPRPGQAGGRFVDGTLLFSDISGFTAMSERLSRIGPEGAEEVTAIINRYFGAMLTIMQGWGGQLIKFGGDALLGLFLEPDSTDCALQAALAMQATMGEFAETHTSQGVCPLQMKVALHRGRFFAAQLGTSEKMEYALFGADVNATAATESAATAGQVLLDRATYAALSLPCVSAPLRDADAYRVVERLSGPGTSPPSIPQMPVPHFPPTLDSLRQAVRLLDASTPYLPAGLLARLVGGPHTLSQEGEHRVVATVFANVHGLGSVVDRLGPGQEAAIIETMNDYFVAMQEAIQSFGGTVNKIDLYDHGDKLLAFFGAPLAHEDDAERAVRAALAMQEAMADRKPAFTQHIGISYGYVFAGYVGAEWRHEYTVMGDQVNMAARLMTVAAPEDIIISDGVRRKVKALFDLSSRGEVRLKGKLHPAPAFAVSGVRAVPESLRGLEGIRSPLVGRETEWAQLLAALDLLHQQRGQIVSITGEAGLGKSRLVAELHQQTLALAAEAQTETAGCLPAIRWIEGRCLSYTETVSYYPCQQVVQALLDMHPDDDETEMWDKLSAGLLRRLSPEQAGAQLPYLANFLNLGWESRNGAEGELPPVCAANPELATKLGDLRAIPTSDLREKLQYLDTEALQRRTFVAIRSLIEAEAENVPLVLVLEDIHWIDKASVTLVEYLMALVDRVPLMFILVYRPEREKECWRIHENATRDFAHCTTEIALQRLPAEDNRQLLVNLIPLEHGSDELAQIILERTEGNPLYLEEILRSLIDTQILKRDSEGRWQIGGPLDSIAVPDTLQGVIMSRLDRLQEACRSTAQVASVIGRTFPFELITQVSEEAPDMITSCMVRLQQQEIVRETQRVPDLVYIFKHSLTQEVCYTSLLARIRRAYHRRVAAALEIWQSARHSEAESNIPLIAHHAFLGQDWHRALHYQILAGQQARRLSASYEAVEHFIKAEQCTEALPTDETAEARLTINATLGELLTEMGQYWHAITCLLQARALAQAQGNRDAESRACRWLARVHELRGDYPTAFTWIEEGLQVQKDAETAETARLRLISGLIYARQGRLDQALEQCQVSLRIAEALGELTVLAQACLLQAVIDLQRGESKVSVEHAQRALALYTRAGDMAGQARTHNQIANAHFNLGQWSAADRAYRQARATFEQIGDVYNRAIADNNLGELALNQGRLDEALAFYEEALRGMEQIGGSPYILGILHNNLGATSIRRNDLDTAREHLQRSRLLFEEIASRDFLPELHRHLAEAALAAGNAAEAENHGRQSLALARELDMQNEAGITLRLLGEIALVRGESTQAVAHLGASLDVLEPLGEEYQEARTRLALAQVYAAQGQAAAVREELARCTSVFERLEAAPDLEAANKLRVRDEE